MASPRVWPTIEIRLVVEVDPLGLDVAGEPGWEGVVVRDLMDEVEAAAVPYGRVAICGVLRSEPLEAH